jgi:pimeloyl-ACP methyl ester carboxylesterase
LKLANLKLANLKLAKRKLAKLNQQYRQAGNEQPVMNSTETNAAATGSTGTGSTKTGSTEKVGERRRAVIFIHGLAAPRSSMALLAYRVRIAGYRVSSFGYPSIWRHIEIFSDRFAEHIQSIVDQDDLDEVNIVAHSLGSIVTRHALREHAFTKLHRVVFLAPPNQGSPVARRFAPWLGRICPPLHQLSDHSESFVNQLEDPQGVSVGIIAAKWDHLVPIENTKLANQADHIVMKGMHTGLLFRRSVAEQVLHFLADGKFHTANSK